MESKQQRYEQWLARFDVWHRERADRLIEYYSANRDEYILSRAFDGVPPAEQRRVYLSLGFVPFVHPVVKMEQKKCDNCMMEYMGNPQQEDTADCPYCHPFQLPSKEEWQKQYDQRMEAMHDRIGRELRKIRR